MQAIVLAGGFGTRLKAVIKEIPKPMAPIGEKPFWIYFKIPQISRGLQCDS